MKRHHWIVFLSALAYAGAIVFVFWLKADIKLMCEKGMISAEVCEARR